MKLLDVTQSSVLHVSLSLVEPLKESIWLTDILIKVTVSVCTNKLCGEIQSGCYVPEFHLSSNKKVELYRNTGTLLYPSNG
jgi:hypothetical protein